MFVRVSDPLARVAELPGVGDAAIEARDAVDRLLGHRVLRMRGGQVSAESALRGARASTALEGRDVPLADVRAGAEAAPLARGAVRMVGELGTLLDTWRRAPLQVLARLHTLAAADIVPSEELGRPRRDSTAADVLALGDPPSPEDVSVRLDALAGLVAAGTTAPAVVTGAVAHGELLTLRPFGCADGLVARAAQRLTLVSRGLDPTSVVVSEVGHLELSEEYAEAARGFASGEPERVGAWVRHCAEAVALGARESIAICESMARQGR